MVHDQAKEPVSLFENFQKIKDRVSGKEVIVFLDYDGTLTPIVERPELAVISEEMRSTVQSLAELYKVSIVSGRATDDVRKKVGLKGIFYAGSHGFEIVYPTGEVKVNEEARAVRGTIDKVHAQLSERLKSVPGALVEHVKYTISAHYRLVSREDFPKVRQAVEETLKENPDLRKTEGKKVFEIRPRIDWDKGKAVQWILGVLNFNKSQLAIYVGDDTTDEDAFRTLNEGAGFGILVAETPRPSAARYRIKNTEEVRNLLEELIRLRQ
jgi:trehalose-phosphatase